MMIAFQLRYLICQILLVLNQSKSSIVTSIFHLEMSWKFHDLGDIFNHMTRVIIYEFWCVSKYIPVRCCLSFIKRLCKYICIYKIHIIIIIFLSCKQADIWYTCYSLSTVMLVCRNKFLALKFVSVLFVHLITIDLLLCFPIYMIQELIVMTSCHHSVMYYIKIL